MNRLDIPCSVTFYVLIKIKKRYSFIGYNAFSQIMDALNENTAYGNAQDKHMIDTTYPHKTTAPAPAEAVFFI